MVALILDFCLILVVVVIVDFSAESYYSKEFKSYFNSLYGVIGRGVPKSEKLVGGANPQPFPRSGPPGDWHSNEFGCRLGIR